jgi:hypothetical protein
VFVAGVEGAATLQKISRGHSNSGIAVIGGYRIEPFRAAGCLNERVGLFASFELSFQGACPMFLCQSVSLLI